MKPNKIIDDLVEEFETTWSDFIGDIEFHEAFAHLAEDSEAPLVLPEMAKWLRTTLTLAYQEGRCSVLAEQNHETRKLLDGFAHPKDCEMCRPINEERA